MSAPSLSVPGSGGSYEIADIRALESRMSRLEARLALEAAVELRYPRLIQRKPINSGLPIDLYALHQAVIGLGGYRKVEIDNLWENVGLQLHIPFTDVHTFKYSLRERALRYLLWTEDECPASRVAQLQSAARHAQGKQLTPSSPGVSQELRGGAIAELAPWYSTSVLRRSETLQSLFAEAPMSHHVAAKPAWCPIAGLRRQAGPPAASAVSADAVLDEDECLTPYMRIAPADDHRGDGALFYKLHDPALQLGGALACHMPPLDMTEDEEAAFPAYSRAANQNTIYGEAQRRDTVRAGATMNVLPQSKASGVLCSYCMEGEDEAQNIQNIAKGMIAAALGSRSSPRIAPCVVIDVKAYVQNVAPNGLDGPETRKRLNRTDPIALRILEGVPEQDPWVGGSVTRTQFYLDIRNHILLKWIQSQFPQASRNVVDGAPTSSPYVTTYTGSAPTHPSFSEGRGGYRGSSTGCWSTATYRPPWVLHLSEVIATLPPRYHEIAAAAFEYLESRGKINVGATRLKVPRAPLPPPKAPVAGDRGAVLPDPIRAQRQPERRRIVIVGAGISGLAAARLLLLYGHDVIVLEARNRPGGRICTNRDKMGIPVDEGAMITTGEEPNPCALLTRQGGLRFHPINNMHSPLLIPLRYHKRVCQIARDRSVRAAAVEKWKDAELSKLAGMVASAAKGSAIAAPPADAGVASQPQPYSPQGRSIFGIRVPPQLSHLSNDAIKHAIRIQSAHTSLMYQHLEFLKRAYKCLTALAMAQVHDPRRRTDGGVEPSYGVLAQGSSIPVKTVQQMDVVHDEIRDTTAWLSRSIEERTINLLNHVIAQSVTSQPHIMASTSQTSSSSAMPAVAAELKPVDKEGIHSDVDMDAPEVSPLSPVPWVLSVPTVIDEEIEGEFNSILEECHELRRLSKPADNTGFTEGYPLVCGVQDPSAFSVYPTTQQLSLPKDWNQVGRELIRSEAAQKSQGSVLLTRHGLPHVDPYAFKFASGADGSISGHGIANWSTDVYPRLRLDKFIDPRKTDDEIDGAYDPAAVEDLAASGTTADLPAKRAGASATAQSSPVGSFRKVEYGYLPLWDVSLANAFECVITRSDRIINGLPYRETYRLLPQKLGFAPAATGVQTGDTNSKSSGSSLVSATEALTPAITRGPGLAAVGCMHQAADSTLEFVKGDVNVPLLPSFAQDSDGAMANGAVASSAAPCRHPYEPYTPDGEPDPDRITYSELRRSILRWHFANLEYGCATSTGHVSLQYWDQDDVYNYHDRGRHFFMKDGYDTLVRCMLDNIPIAYDSPVTDIVWHNAAALPRCGTDRDPGDDYRVTVMATPSNGAPVTYEADAVIVTVPVGVLQAGSINFMPPLPDWKQAAIRSIGAGLLNKVILRFPTAFWRKAARATAADVSAVPSADAATKAIQPADLTSISKPGVDNNTQSLLAQFGWGALEPPLPQQVKEDRQTSITPSSESALLTGPSFPAPRDLPVPTPNATQPSTVTTAGQSALAPPVDWVEAIRATWKQHGGPYRLKYFPIPRVVSFVPCMDMLARFHLQPCSFTDSQLMTACALALQDGAQHPSARMDDKTGVRNCSLEELQRVRRVLDRTSVFYALLAVARARGDMASSGSLLNAWLSPLDALEERKEAPPPEILSSDIPHDLRDVYQVAADYAAAVFPLPAVSPPQSVNQLTPAGSKASDSDAPQKPFEGELSDAAISARLRRYAKTLQHQAADMSSGPVIEAQDDAFGRVRLGDQPANVKGRGEAYMFWCMDRPGAGATVYPVSHNDAEDADVTDSEDTSPVLIAMMAGDAAEWVEVASDADVVSAVMLTLQSLFGADAVPQPTSHIITRWRSDPYAKMSYSYLPTHSHGLHYDLMAAPVVGRVFFAGEATNRHHPTTAAGAFDSGLREAVRLARMFGKSRDPDVEAILNAREARVGVIVQHAVSGQSAAPPSMGQTYPSTSKLPYAAQTVARQSTHAGASRVTGVGAGRQSPPAALRAQPAAAGLPARAAAPAVPSAMPGSQWPEVFNPFPSFSPQQWEMQLLWMLQDPNAGPSHVRQFAAAYPQLASLIASQTSEYPNSVQLRQLLESSLLPQP